MKNFLEINRTPSGVKKNSFFSPSGVKKIVQSPARWLLTLIAILTLGVGQMWATVTIYAVGNMQDKNGTWRDEKTTLYCHNWGSSETTWPGTSMTKWNDVSVDGHQVFKCNLKADGNTSCIFNTNGGWQTNDITNLNSTVKAYPYPTYLNGTWYYSPRVCKALWESDQHAYGGRIYFDNSSASWGDTYMYFVIGHGSHVGYYRITNIGNTKLYYVDLGSQSWGDSKYVAVVGNSSSKTTGSGNPNNLAALTHFSDAYQYSLEYQSTYLVSMSSGTNCSQISMDYKSGGYSDFNSTQTINTVVKAAGGSYTSANSKATISITSYEMTGDGAVTKRTPSISTSAKQATVSAARTATTTLSVGDVATGYQFDGWYTAATGGTKLSESTTYTYYPTSATTVYARFSEKTFTVTVTNDGNGTTSPSGAQSNKGQITGVAVSATPSDGYNFNNWTITSGTGSFADATDASTTFYPTGTATIRANFVSAATSTLTVTATTGGSITTPAAGYYSDITTTGYSIAASRSEGYKFTGWTKTAGDGAVSFANASSLSTTATITTLGDVTVTAGFAAMSNLLSVSSSSVYAGSDVTLTATKTNHTLDLKYQYKIGTGSWNTITTKSGTSHTYTIPYANTYQTYYFRVVSTDGSTDIISPTQTVEVKGRITIHVKNTNSWATMKLYSWYNDGSDHATNGAWNGTTGSGSNGQSCSIHATGSLWWDVTITQTTSNAQKFILSCSTSGDQNKTADLNLSSFTHDAYYAMSTNGSSAQTLSTTTTPAAPTLSTSAAGTIRETSAVLGGNVTNLGNDIISERGYYWSTNSVLSSSNLSVGTKVTVSGTQSATGTFNNTKSSLTAGTKYYFIAYAKNGYGTSYGAVNNFTTLSTYTVTVTAGAGGTASPSSVTAGQYQTSGTITATANTGYTFYNWMKTSGSGTVTFTNANAASTTVNSTSTATVQANFVDMWNVKGSWDSWAAYEPMTATGVSNTYSATKTLAAKTEYHIKVVKRVDNNSSNDKWYGVNGGKTLTRASGSVTGLEENGGENEYITFTTDAAGDYTITYLYNASVGSMKVTVGYPTAYTITYGVGTLKGCSTAVSVSPSFTSGDYVLPETDVTFSKGSTKAGYTWKGWYSNVGGTGEAWSTNDASLSLTDTRTGNISVYACYNYATYTATLSTTGSTGYGSGAPANQTATYTQAMPTITPPTAANGYCFMGYWDDEEGAGTQYYNANGTSAHVWDKTSSATLYAYFKKAEITSVTFASAIVEPGATVTATANIEPTPAGTTTVCWRLLHDNGNEYSPQPTFTPASGTTVSFTAPETSTHYKVEAKLRTGSSCDGGTLLDTETGRFQVAGSHTVTVNYKCGDDVIKAATSVTATPLDWTEEFTAPDIFGYTFARWDAADGVTIKNGESDPVTTSTNATIQIEATYNGKLTAVYTQKSMIFFKNTLGWSDVYVNFYTGSYWNNPKGSGNSGVTNRNKHMTQIGETDIWYYDYGAASISPSLYVSFTSDSQDGSENFWKSGGVNVVYPANYADNIHSDRAAENGFKAATPMFVPLAAQEGVTLNQSSGGKADYYNAGYWTKYTSGTGYILEIYNSEGNFMLKSAEFTSADDLMPMKAVVDLEGGQTYKFQLRRGGNGDAGFYYGNSGTMTYTSHGQDVPWDLSNYPSISMVGITTNAAGDYTFNLSYSGHAVENPHYRLRIAVDYPVASGDYRVIYKDAVHTNWHPSAIVSKANNRKDTVSFFVRPGSSPEMKIQTAAVDGKTGAVSWGSDVAIPTATLTGLASTDVYNFNLSMNGSGAISLEGVDTYTGNYYIRTDAANSKWDNYRSDPDHLMTYSEYSIEHGGYTHYHAHWVNKDDAGRKNVKFVIANDYSPCISDTLIREEASGTWANIASFITEGGDLLRSANVRYMWDKRDNSISRAYVDGAQEDGSEFLTIQSSDSKIKNAAGNATLTQVTFSDNGNWMYEADIKAQPTAQIKLLSKWGESNIITQYFRGGESTTETLIGGSGSNWYDIRLIYDFKTNRLIAGLIPSGTIDDQMAIHADVMFIREHQGDIAQLTFSEKGGKMGAITDIETAYGVLRFNKWTINNKSKADGHAPLSPLLSAYERDLFYVSFPFKVSMEEVFGFGTYGKHWIIEEYDGASRAANGYWQESDPNWKFVFNRKNKFFEPGRGYIIALDLDELGESSSVWANTDQVELYFPSYGTMSNITSSTVTYEIPEHLCTINRSQEPKPGGGTLGDAYDRRVKDSHWNVLGVPTYVNPLAPTYANTDWITEATETSIGPNFLYAWNKDDNSVSAVSASGFTYHAMHAYLVQYCGNVTWTSSVSVSQSLAPRYNSEYRGDYEFRIELQQNNATVDQTFVKLSDNEAVTNGFEFNYDLSKEFNKNRANIYTMIGTEQVAGNCLPLTEQTTIVPVGVKVPATGEYTFTMPDGTFGRSVTLIDNESGFRTNLGLGNYTVELTEGTYEGRFVLEIPPISQTPTDIENSEISSQDSAVRKVIVDGLLYIVKDGVVYDARGAKVQ